MPELRVCPRPLSPADIAWQPLQYLGRPMFGRCVILPVGKPLPLRKGAVEPLARIRRRLGVDKLR